MVNEELDGLDRAIVSELQRDGRMSFREIGRALSVAESTVRSRVKRLQHAGILSIVAFIDPLQIGHYTLSLLLVKVNPVHHEQVARSLVERPEVTYMSTALSGRADLLVEFSAGNDEHKWEFVNQVVRSLDGVLAVEILSIVRTHKITYRLPVSPSSSA